MYQAEIFLLGPRSLFQWDSLYKEELFFSIVQCTLPEFGISLNLLCAHG